MNSDQFIWTMFDTKLTNTRWKQKQHRATHTARARTNCILNILVHTHAHIPNAIWNELFIQSCFSACRIHFHLCLPIYSVPPSSTPLVGQRAHSVLVMCIMSRTGHRHLCMVINYAQQHVREHVHSAQIYWHIEDINNCI